MKFEVGKKYLTRDFKGWAKIVFDKRELSNANPDHLKYPLIAVHDDGKTSLLTKDGKIWDDKKDDNDLVVEYEPIKNSVKGWVAYDPTSKPLSSYLDYITNLSTDGKIYKEKFEEHPYGPSLMYGRFTFEQLLEPKE